MHGFGKGRQAPVNLSLLLCDGQQCVAKKGQIAHKIRVSTPGGIFAPDGISAPVIAVFDSAPMSANEPMPLGFRMVIGFVTADIVAHGHCFFAVTFALEPDRDNASGIREADLYRMGLNHCDRALLDPSVRLFRGAVTWCDRCKDFFDLFEQVALIALYLQKIVASLFDNDSGCCMLVVQGVCGDGLSVEFGLLPDQFLRGFEFAGFARAFFLEQCAMAAGTPVS